MLSAWDEQVLLCFVVGFLCIGDQQLRHVVDNHADPFAVHDLEGTDSLEVPITLLEGLKDLIGIAGRFPAFLLVQVPRVLQEVDGPLGERLPIGLVFRDPRLIQLTLRLHELLRHRLLVDTVLTFELNVRFELIDDFGPASPLDCYCEL